MSDRHEHLLLECLPDDVIASMEARSQWVADLPPSPGGFEFFVNDLQSWGPGQTVRVAFLGGTPELHQAIEDATQTITDVAHLTLSFRDDTAYRTWTENDEEYAAEIRVSFDLPGNFSLVGTDSASSVIGQPEQLVGGRPHQRSLNLGGFDSERPAGWRGTIRHEFLHALSFHHEHQNMRGQCEHAFRWDDDPGYQPTKDSCGAFNEDRDGRQPGIYTYLSGYPNYWSREKVDRNMRTNHADPRVVAGPFDSASVMLYRFEPMFYKINPSPCAPLGDGQELSEGDIRALKLLYPRAEMPIATINQRRQDMIATIESTSVGGYESISAYKFDALNRLQTP
jgi:hypothetical protein